MSELKEYNGTLMAPRLCNGMIPAAVTRLKAVGSSAGSSAVGAWELRVGFGLVLARDDRACL